MKRFLGYMRHWKDLWLDRLLMFLLIAYFCWAALSKEYQAATVGVIIFGLLFFVTLVVGVWVFYNAPSLINKKRPFDVAYAMQADWVLRGKWAWAMFTLMILGGSYAVWIKTCGLEVHYFAKISAMLMVICLFKHERKCREKYDFLFEEIREELVEKGYYDKNGNVIGFPIVPERGVWGIK